jgi:hypothetical protein
MIDRMIVDHMIDRMIVDHMIDRMIVRFVKLIFLLQFQNDIAKI